MMKQKNSDGVKAGDLATIKLRKAVDGQTTIVGYVKTLTDEYIVMSDKRIVEWINVDNVLKVNLDDGPATQRREVKLL